MRKGEKNRGRWKAAQSAADNSNVEHKMERIR